MQETSEKPKKELSSRVFNIMQYLRHPTTGETLLTEETVRGVLSTYRTITDWAYIIHDRDIKDDGITIKPPHFHIVIRTPRSPVTIQKISTWFGIPENFIDIPKGRGAFYDCVGYLTHALTPDKTRYLDENVQSNFDWKQALENYYASKDRNRKYTSKNEKVDEWLLLLNAGAVNLADLRAEDPVLYIRNYPVLNRCRNTYLKNLPAPSTRINWLITGNAGYGKSLASRAIARQLYTQVPPLPDHEIFFEIGDGKVSFEGYEGQPVIIWNDARPKTLLDMLGSRDNLFNVFDCFPSNRRQNIKYDSISLNNRYNIINTVMPWSDFIKGLAGEYIAWDGRHIFSEDANQSSRRFPIIMPLQKDYYDVYLNEGWLDPDGDYSEYVAYRQIIGNFGEIRKRLKAKGYSETVIHALGAECDKKLSAPVVEIVRQEIEPALAGKTIDLDSEEDINRLIESMTPYVGRDRLEYAFRNKQE